MVSPASYTVHDSLKSLGSPFMGTYTYEGMESRLAISQNLFSGHVYGYQLMPGLGLVKNALKIDSAFSYTRKSPRSFLKLSFFLDADLEISSWEKSQYPKTGYFMLNYINRHDKVLVKPKQCSLCSLEVIIRPGFFWGLDKNSLFSKAKPSGSTIEFLCENSLVYPIPPHILNRVTEIWNNKDYGLFRILNLQSKVCDLLYQMLQIFGDTAKNSSGSIFQKMQEAKRILESNYQYPFTLKELSKEVGVNETKLKKEFKKAFGTTIFKYLTQLRMKKSQNVLMEQKLSVNDVAEYCGYQNTSKFISAFKKQFGLTPGQYRQSWSLI